ncbi:nickel pincer cofactor biosynthesis protein LarC [bacterium]|nr:nickel pincer cofactor biosynthesis protein LarC [bacterium]MBU1598737.1 nickel pincer cofactor biosynthesis protein LarC [bacterium]
MKIAYLDASSGVSGDMLLGAIIDYGIDLALIREELTKLNIEGWTISERKKKVGHIETTKVDVQTDISLSGEEMLRVIKESHLKCDIKELSLKILTRLISSEMAVHKSKELHLHQLGSLDTIIDIVGTVIGFQLIGLDAIYSSSLNLGSPAPATLKLVEGFDISSTTTQDFELTTPTGAAIVTTLAERFGKMPQMRLIGSGFGSGDYEKERDYLLLIVGERQEADEVVLLEVNLDDITPQIFSYVMERLFEKGALDVWFTPIQMKKNRPATKLSCLTTKEKEKEAVNIIFSETTTGGIRRSVVERYILPRESGTISTDYGEIGVKKSGNKLILEYEDIRRIAKERKIPFLRLQKDIDSLTNIKEKDKL